MLTGVTKVEQRTTEKTHVCTIQQWTLHQWRWRLITTRKWYILFLDMHPYSPFVLITYPSEANKPGCGQLSILDSAEAPIKWLENQTKGVWLK
jgi:hypothetical protein